MADKNPGSIVWQDLTVSNADEVRDFYSAVVGWRAQPEHMGEYADYNMIVPEVGQRVAGICHARGVNADLPAQWLIYITVADIEAAAAKCVELGGNVVAPIRECGSGKLCVIQDPAGAMCALFQ